MATYLFLADYEALSKTVTVPPEKRNLLGKFRKLPPSSSRTKKKDSPLRQGAYLLQLRHSSETSCQEVDLQRKIVSGL